jgi:hypothetical protein
MYDTDTCMSLCNFTYSESQSYFQDSLQCNILRNYVFTFSISGEGILILNCYEYKMY